VQVVPSSATQLPLSLNLSSDPRRSVYLRNASFVDIPATRAIRIKSYGESVITLSRQHSPH
jgi:hypothetical protein